MEGYYAFNFEDCCDVIFTTSGIIKAYDVDENYVPGKVVIDFSHETVSGLEQLFIEKGPLLEKRIMRGFLQSIEIDDDYLNELNNYISTNNHNGINEKIREIYEFVMEGLDDEACEIGSGEDPEEYDPEDYMDEKW